MKKLNILLIAGIAMGGFASCGEAPAVAPMQKNEQGQVVEVSDYQIEATGAFAKGEVLDLDKAPESIEMFKITSNTLPEGLTITNMLDLCGDKDFNGAIKTVELTTGEGVINIKSEDLQSGHIVAFSEGEQNESTLYYRVYAIVKTSLGSSYRLGLDDTYIAVGQLKETPMVSKMSADFIGTPGGFNGDNARKSQFMSGNPSDLWGLINIKDSFKIVDKIDGKGTTYGGADGILTENGPAIVPSEGNGLYFVKANIFDFPSYSMTKVNTIGVIGGAQSWSTEEKLTPNADQTIWKGTVNLSGEWKLRINDNWSSSFGGTYTELNPNNGGNFSAVGASCEVTLDLTGRYPKLIVVKK